MTNNKRDELRRLIHWSNVNKKRIRQLEEEIEGEERDERKKTKKDESRFKCAGEMCGYCDKLGFECSKLSDADFWMLFYKMYDLQGHKYMLEGLESYTPDNFNNDKEKKRLERVDYVNSLIRSHTEKVRDEELVFYCNCYTCKAACTYDFGVALHDMNLIESVYEESLDFCIKLLKERYNE